MTQLNIKPIDLFIHCTIWGTLLGFIGGVLLPFIWTATILPDLTWSVGSLLFVLPICALFGGIFGLLLSIVYGVIGIIFIKLVPKFINLLSLSFFAIVFSITSGTVVTASINTYAFAELDTRTPLSLAAAIVAAGFTFLGTFWIGGKLFGSRLNPPLT